MGNTVKTVYFDMDGVLVDLATHLEGLEGKLLSEIYNEHGKSRPHFDPVVFLIKKHISNRPFIYAKPTKDFDKALNLMKILTEMGIDVEILSSCTNQPESDDILIQKKEWLEKHLPYKFVSHFPKGGLNKYLWANENTVLIDDLPRNINEFRKHKGHAILHENFDKTQTELLSILKG